MAQTDLEEQVQSVLAIRDRQCAEPSVHADAYMTGMANGLILAGAILTGIEPEFVIFKPTGEQ